MEEEHKEGGLLRLARLAVFDRVMVYLPCVTVLREVCSRLRDAARRVRRRRCARAHNPDELAIVLRCFPRQQALVLWDFEWEDEHVASLTEATRLTLPSGSRVTRAGLARLDKLTHLCLGSCDAGVGAALAHLTNLTDLQVAGQVSAAVLPLRSMSLRLVRFSTLSDAAFAPLSKLASLELSNCCRHDLTGSFLAGLTNLRRLHVGGESMADAAAVAWHTEHRGAARRVLEGRGAR